MTGARKKIGIVGVLAGGGAHATRGDVREISSRFIKLFVSLIANACDSEQIKSWRTVPRPAGPGAGKTPLVHKYKISTSACSSSRSVHV